MSEVVEPTFAYVRAYIAEHGWAPSYAEIMVGTGIQSKSTVHHHLLALEREGRIVLGHGARMIALPRDTEG